MQGSKPKHNPSIEVGPEFGITFTPAPKGREPVVAVGGTWNAMPRQPRLLTENLQPYITAAAEILKSKGITNPQVKLTQVVEIDLDGDGVNEVLVCARRFTMAHLYDALNDGDYSMVFLHLPVGEKMRNILIEGQFQAPSRPKSSMARTRQVIGLVDADGDGVMEIVVNCAYYEGGGTELYQLRGDKVDVDLVLYEDWGL
ncbi:MAG: VCBS repeat-containing protein [Proteobacteria bacterium]|nr:VCBS repeat-containing protein [Pseudomonadota bacterium]MBU4354672.1 VCBS repeat-containing protein [Pseudomonadota bacterium]